MSAARGQRLAPERPRSSAAGPSAEGPGQPTGRRGSDASGRQTKSLRASESQSFRSSATSAGEELPASRRVPVNVVPFSSTTTTSVPVPAPPISPIAPAASAAVQQAALSSAVTVSLPVGDEEAEEVTDRYGRSIMPARKASEGGGDEKEAKVAEDGRQADEALDADDPRNDPDLAWMPVEWRDNLIAQTYVKPRTEATFWELFRFTTPFEHFLNALGIVCAIIVGIANPGMTVFFGNLTTDFTTFGQAVVQVQNGADPDILLPAREKLISSVNKDAGYLVAVGAGLFLATFIYTATWIYTGEATTRRIRELYLKAVLRQNVAYFDKLGAGEVTTRIQTDTHLIQDGISDKLPLSVSFVAQFFAGFVIAYVRNWRLSLILSSCIPVIAISGIVMNKYMSRYRQQMLEQTALGGTMAEESISSVRNAHAFGTQMKLLELYEKFNAMALAIGKKSAFVNAIAMMIFFFVIYGAYALAFWEGSRLLVQGLITSGGVINVFFSILIASFSLAQLAPNMQAISFAQGAASKLFATIDRVPPIDSSNPQGIKPDHCEGRLEFKDVHFVYPSRPKVHVLKGFSSTFARGKSTALVGQSGSGKSTIIGLIERFYDPVQGSVLLDGRDIRTYNIKWLRSQVGLVMQEPTLFATTVFGNVAMGLINTEFEFAEEDVKRKMVIEACTKANAHSFIETLQKGYDTHIGERGSLLSGGQKQRVAIARAIVSDPKILLLDEATSALDTASEGIVQDALDKAASGRTTITIAHRLSTIKNADQIIVMQSGSIIETGNHVSLVAKPEGAYKRLVEAQKLREEADDSESATLAESSDDLPLSPRPKTIRRISTKHSSVMVQDLMQDQQNRGLPRKALRKTFMYAFYRLGKLNKESVIDYVLGMTASGVIGAMYPVFGIVFGSILSVFSDPNPDNVIAGGKKYGLYLFIICLVATTCVFLQSYCMSVSAERLSRIMRNRTFKAILRQDIAFFDEEEHASGKLTADISDWAQKVNGLAGITLGVVVQSIVLIITGTIIAIVTQWRIGLVGASCTPILIAAGFLRLRVVVLKDAKTKKAHEASAQLACEAAGAIRTVAALTREDDAWNVYRQSLDEPQRKSNRIAIGSNLLYSVGQGCTFWAISLIFWYGAHRLVADSLTTRQFFTCLICTIFAAIQAGSIFNFVPDMSKARSASLDYLKLVDSRPTIDTEEPTGATIPPVEGHVVLKDVHFRYASRPDIRVLRGLDLEVKPGQFAALVGPSGCGKSTLISLVERFYDPVLGRVLVDGRDISELNIVDYRRNLSLVSQEPTLYAGSIRFNILLGANRPADEISQEEIENACRQANIHDFIMSLPDGYETDVGGKGTMLSGGQKQRIAIARALIRDPRILLLDEATSALDSESEKVVQVALDKAAKGRTTIAIAHRISSIQNADVIFVLQDGKVAEQGRHHELLAQKGIYFELVAQQGLERAA